jgi:hypothetical protein
MENLGDRVLAVGRALVRELEIDSPVYRAILTGRVGREAYIAFLVQHHKHIRHTHGILVRYAEAMAASPHPAYRTTLRSGAARHSEEERGHDHSVLRDLGVFWGCTEEEARARVDATETAPAVRLYEAIFETSLARFPCAIGGLAAALESVASAFCGPALEALLASRPWPEVETATRLLRDHVEDGEHLEGCRARLSLVRPGHDAFAVYAVARMTAVYYRELIRYIDSVVAGRVEAPIPALGLA